MQHVNRVNLFILLYLTLFQLWKHRYALLHAFVEPEIDGRHEDGSEAH